MDYEAKNAARKETENKLIAKFEKDMAKPLIARYSAVLIIVLIVFNIFDQVSTNIFNQFEDAITVFFAKLGAEAEVWVKFDMWGTIVSKGSGYDSYQVMNGKLTLGSTVGFALLAVSPFYKALADKYGRRPFFIINCIGLIISVFIGFLSYYVFTAAKGEAGETFAILLFIFSLVATIFFTIQDIQMLYIFEVISEDKRATVFGIAKGIGLFASVFVIASRLFSIKNIAGIQWQFVYLAVAVFGVIALLVAVFGLRESKPFMEQRIEYLKLTDEEREIRRVEQNKNKIGVLGGLKTMFGNKQLKMLAIAMLCVSVANNMVCSKANSIMIQSGMSTLYITLALIVAKVVEATLNVIMGWLSDKFGRKPVALLLAAFNAVGMTTFCFFAVRAADMSALDWSDTASKGAVFVGVMYGVALSSYLCLLDQINLMTSESAPTYLRGSIVGCSSIFRITAVIALVFQSVLAVKLHTPTAWICFVLSVPFIIAAAILIFVKVNETKGKTIAEVDSEF